MNKMYYNSNQKGPNNLYSNSLANDWERQKIKEKLIDANQHNQSQNDIATQCIENKLPATTQ